MIEDPLVSYRFVVTLDAADAYLPPEQAALVPRMAEAGFHEVTGLGGDLEVTDYSEGGRNGFVHRLPVRHSWQRIALRRGLVRGTGLWEWYEAGLTRSLGARRDGTIVVQTPDGDRATAWVFRAGIAAKWSGPDLRATDNAVAIEALEIAHHGLERVTTS